MELNTARPARALPEACDAVLAIAVAVSRAMSEVQYRRYRTSVSTLPARPSQLR